MKKYRICAAVITMSYFALVFPAKAFANSSWRWISETRPYDVLPWVVAITLIVETVAINYIPQAGKLPKVFCIVSLANLMSFAAPYLFHYFVPDMTGVSRAEDFNRYLEHWPSYTIGLLYYLATIAVELPVVYNLLKNDVKNKRRLLITIVAVNVVTTVMVAVVERLFCRGKG